MLDGGHDVSDEDRIAALEARFTASLEAMESRIDQALSDMTIAVNRAVGGLTRRTSDLETASKAHGKQLEDHSHRLAAGDVMLREFREFRTDFESWANGSARLFRTRGPSNNSEG